MQRNKKHHNRNANTGATYIWRVTWWNRDTCRDYEKTFTNKQQALMYLSKIKVNSRNDYVRLDKWYGD